MHSIHSPSSRRERRPAVVADFRIVGPQRLDEVNLHAIDLRPCRSLRLPQDVSGDREALPQYWGVNRQGAAFHAHENDFSALSKTALCGAERQLS